MMAFKQYHSQWKPTTRNFEKRLKKLQTEGVYIISSDYPRDISENLKEAYSCYINDSKMACYIMILRTIEIAVNMVYVKYNPIEIDAKGKNSFIPAIQKLNWAKNQKKIGGAEYIVAKGFIEARNESVHELYIPTEKQIMSAFETVIILSKELLKN